jgi:hypothetical protein
MSSGNDVVKIENLHRGKKSVITILKQTDIRLRIISRVVREHTSKYRHFPNDQPALWWAKMPAFRIVQHKVGGNCYPNEFNLRATSATCITMIDICVYTSWPSVIAVTVLYLRWKLRWRKQWYIPWSYTTIVVEITRMRTRLGMYSNRQKSNWHPAYRTRCMPWSVCCKSKAVSIELTAKAKVSKTQGTVRFDRKGGKDGEGRVLFLRAVNKEP